MRGTIGRMSLVRAWSRQLYGASGVALLVPGAVGLALVALAVAGGFGQLGDLSQAFAGPAAPAPVRVPGATSAARNAAAAAVLPVVVAAAPPTRVAATGAPGHRGAAPAGGNKNPHAGVGPVATSGPGTGSTGTGTPGGTGGTPPGGIGGGPPGGTGSGSTLVDRVIGVGTSVSSQLPAPVGSTATGVLQSVGKGVDSILSNSGASSAVPGVTSAVTGATSGATGAAKSLVPGVQLP
jgi:hypothetical protein